MGPGTSTRYYEELPAEDDVEHYIVSIVESRIWPRYVKMQRIDGSFRL